MNKSLLVRALVALACLLTLGWVGYHTRWVEVDIDDPVKGAAADDRYYALRTVLKASGASLAKGGTFDKLPPTSATLVLDATQWDLFSERDARLRAWVEAGGHLVVPAWQLDGKTLRWIPIVQHRAPTPRHRASAPDGDDDDDDADTAPPPSPRAAPGRARGIGRAAPRRACVEDYVETSTSVPAFETWRHYHGCIYSATLLTSRGVEPTWQLMDGRNTIALRVPVGRGRVTSLYTWQLPPGAGDPPSAEANPMANFAPPRDMLDNRGLPLQDTALIVSAILDVKPGSAIWIFEDEDGEPLSAWVWHHARAPLLLGLAAVALAIWRLMVRFGPREAPAAQARRSMGEQVRGTGEFIAATDPAALHSATRRAFDDAARTRLEGYASLDDPERVALLAQQLAPVLALDQPALLGALNAAPRANTAQWLAAIATIEEARRALLRAPAPPIA